MQRVPVASGSVVTVNASIAPYAAIILKIALTSRMKLAVQHLQPVSIKDGALSQPPRHKVVFQIDLFTKLSPEITNEEPYFTSPNPYLVNDEASSTHDVSPLTF